MTRSCAKGGRPFANNTPPRTEERLRTVWFPPRELRLRASQPGEGRVTRRLCHEHMAGGQTRGARAPRLRTPVTAPGLDVSQVSWGLRHIQLVFAPRLTWRGTGHWPCPRGSRSQRVPLLPESFVLRWSQARKEGPHGPRHHSFLCAPNTWSLALLLRECAQAQPRPGLSLSQVSLGCTCTCAGTPCPSLTHTTHPGLHRNTAGLDRRRNSAGLLFSEGRSSLPDADTPGWFIPSGAAGRVPGGRRVPGGGEAPCMGSAGTCVSGEAQNMPNTSKP